MVYWSVVDIPVIVITRMVIIILVVEPRSQKKIFETLGLETDRLRLTWISASEGNKFAQVGNEYTKQILAMGENPTKKNIFL